MSMEVEAPAVAGTPRLLLRLEGPALFAVAAFLYPKVSDSWWLFAALVLVPDLSFLGYLAGPRVGAAVYNAAHVTIGPFVLVILGFVLPVVILEAIALIWLAHIGVDRLLGYGLKYPAGFAFRHLGKIGRSADPA
jgi:hypothetical protein